MAGDAQYDFQAGRYSVAAMTNEEPAATFNEIYKADFFTPDNLKRVAQ
jgi:hypothetical protein